MKFTLVSVLFVASVGVATPAFALNAVEAINQCSNTPGCSSHVQNDGSVLLEGEGGWMIECTNMGSQCFVLSEGGGSGERLLEQAEPKKKTPKAFVVTPSLGSNSDDGDSDNSSFGGGAPTADSGPMAPEP